MPQESDSPARVDYWPELVKRVRERTPARLLTGRSGGAYRTSTHLELREAHAAARDAVRADSGLLSLFGDDFVRDFGLFEVQSQATDKIEYLLQPSLGRRLGNNARADISSRCAAGRNFQIVVGDGLSVTAVATQVPQLLPSLIQGARARNWSLGQPLLVHYCRVGILNAIGELLNPDVAILLIGERPGLATAESLSAYMAYRPNSCHTDANRNLISNIHSRGVTVERAAERILNLAGAMLKSKQSGCLMRESLPSLIPPASASH
jgi:ethanolamine ammonia-lyase small subunit